MALKVGTKPTPGNWALPRTDAYRPDLFLNPCRKENKVYYRHQENFSEEYNEDRDDYFKAAETILNEACARIGKMTQARVDRWGADIVSAYFLVPVNRLINNHYEIEFDDIFPGSECPQGGPERDQND